MKTPRSLGKSRNGRINQTIQHAEAIVRVLRSVQGTPHNEPILIAEIWTEARERAARLSQCFHEANAYNNAMVPDGEYFDTDEEITLVKSAG